MPTETDFSVDDVEEKYDRFETVDVVHDGLDNKNHHTRVSVKYQTGSQLEIDSLAIQPFMDKTTPNRNMGFQFHPDQLDDLITALELIRYEYLTG